MNSSKLSEPRHSRQIEKDFYVSPSEESVIDDSDADPNYARPHDTQELAPQSNF